MDRIQAFLGEDRSKKSSAASSTSQRSKNTSNLVQNLVQQLSGALTYPDLGNLETNKRLWNRYADEWNPSSQWVSEMAAGSKQEAESKENVDILGDEWSTTQDLDQVIEEFIKPFVEPESIVAEIGVGGGRIAKRLLSLCQAMTCMDISASMLEKAKVALSTSSSTTSIDFILLDSLDYPARLQGQFDFVYCFDVLAHVDLHNIFKTLQQIYRLLKPGGKAFVSTANVLSPAGWQRFEKQKKYTVGGFYFISPDITNKLLTEAGFRLLKTSDIPPTYRQHPQAQGGGSSAAEQQQGNLYYTRDYLVVVEKAGNFNSSSKNPSTNGSEAGSSSSPSTTEGESGVEGGDSTAER